MCILLQWLYMCIILITDVIRGYAQEVESNGTKSSRDTPSAFTGHSGAGKPHQY